MEFFKEGNQWKCCFDPEKGLYTAQIGHGVNCTLYEITKEIYENVDESDDDWSANLIREGRRLFMSVNDKCGLPYTVVLDITQKNNNPLKTSGLFLNLVGTVGRFDGLYMRIAE